jgi:uncharacterized membrane protein
MILQLASDAPLLVRAVAAAALVLHIGGASVGLASGAVAMVARKGERLHRAAGNVFFVSMLTMSGVAAIVSPMLPDRISAVAGLFTFYLTATAWATVRRRPGEAGFFEVGAMFGGLGVAALFLSLARIAAMRPGGVLEGQSYEIGVAFGLIALLAAALDLRTVQRGGLSGTPRVARHLWRMCLALFMASGSFFLGQQQVLPEALRGSPILFVPALAPLAAMVFWLVRVRFARAFRPVAAAAAA